MEDRERRPHDGEKGYKNLIGTSPIKVRVEKITCSCCPPPQPEQTQCGLHAKQ